MELRLLLSPAHQSFFSYLCAQTGKATSLYTLIVLFTDHSCVCYYAKSVCRDLPAAADLKKITLIYCLLGRTEIE